MAEHNDLGKLGEEIAVSYLRENGYQIKETNWRFGKDEIDIIAVKNKMLVVFEVKTRRSAAFGEPEIFVTAQKQRFLIRATQVYLERYKIDSEARFDIISIVIDNSKPIIKHIADAFYPTLS
ncbi:MAG: YraN family protein [Lentimicrobiaceae bacterium]|nr:YraN family protein [Lentimicrobiaceae bacterium]